MLRTNASRRVPLYIGKHFWGQAFRIVLASMVAASCFKASLIRRRMAHLDQFDVSYHGRMSITGDNKR